MNEAELIWQNGEFLPWAEAKTDVLSHGLHYGTGVFEGIRCYETERGPAICRHQDHLERLTKSAQLYYFELPYSTAAIAAAPPGRGSRAGLSAPPSPPSSGSRTRPSSTTSSGPPRPPRSPRPPVS